MDLGFFDIGGVVFFLRALFLIPEAIIYKNKNRYFYHLSALAVMGYIFVADKWHPKSYDVLEWSAYMLEAAVTIQAIADLQHYFLYGIRKEKWLQFPLWVIHVFQFFALWCLFVPLLIVPVYVVGAFLVKFWRLRMGK